MSRAPIRILLSVFISCSVLGTASLLMGSFDSFTVFLLSTDGCLFYHVFCLIRYTYAALWAMTMSSFVFIRMASTNLSDA